MRDAPSETNKEETDTNFSEENSPQEQNLNPLPNIPFFPSDLTSMLNDDQKETLDLLKSLFSEES